MLKSFAIAVFAVILCTQASIAQSSPAWEKFTFKGAFEVLFPGKPTLEAEKVVPGDGRTFQHQYFVESPTGFFLVSQGGLADKVTDAGLVLDAVITGIVGDGKLDAKTPITEDGLPGRKFKVTTKSGGLSMVSSGKVLLNGQTLFIVMATSTTSGTASPDIEKFISSLRVMK